MRRSPRESSRRARRALALSLKSRRLAVDVLEDRTLLSVITPYNSVFSANTTGDIALVANTLMTATGAGHVAVQNGTSSTPNNDQNNMSYVNVDPSNGHFDSSSAQLILPAGATVLFAGLNWGGLSRAAQINQCLLQTPASTDYQTITATSLSTYVNTNLGENIQTYSGFTDVTSLVAAGGSGTYTVANVHGTQGTQAPTGNFAGWALVVAYTAPGLPARQLNIFNGYANVQDLAGSRTLNIPITGFEAPGVGPVNAEVGVVAYEGDIGVTGDSLQLNSTTLKNATNPGNNFFNSSISNNGVLVTTTNPNYINQTGIDADLVAANGVIPPGATSATVTMTTNSDFYLPTLITTVIDVPTVDLALTKTVSDATPNVGDTISFTVGLSNLSSTAATGVAVTEALPAGLTFISATPSQGTYSPATGIWTIGTVDTTAHPSLVIQAIVVSPNAETNFATISHSDQLDPDPGNNSGSATETPQQADLIVNKSVTDPEPSVGEVVTYTVFLVNAGPDVATDVTIKDLLPAGLEFVSYTASQGTYDAGTGIWNVGSVDTSRVSKTLMIEARVTQTGASVNIAAVDHSDQYDPDTDNNQAQAPTSATQADLSLLKRVVDANDNPDPRPNVGDTIFFTVGLANAGPSNATGVQVTDLFPATGLTILNVTAPPGTTYDQSTGIWNVGSVIALATRLILTIECRVDSPDPETNIASVTHSDQDDPNPGNNSDSVTETPQQADLQVLKSVDNSAPNVGGTVNFTVSLNNLGPDNATNVTVSDLLPAGLIFVSASTSQGSYDAGTGIWTVGSVTTASAQALVITATVPTADAITNVASVAHSDQYDPNPNNNSDAATEVPQQSDLEVTKTVDDSTPDVGDTISFTVSVNNLGPDFASNIATNVTVEDLLAPGLQFVSATPSQGTYDSTTGLWTVGSIPVGPGPTLVIQALVQSAEPQTNVASINHSDQYDPDPGNNSDSVTETPQQADLAVTKTVDDDTPNVGATISFTVSLTNLGPDTATNVSLGDLLPAGLQFVSAGPSQGTYNDGTGVWTVGAVAANAAPLTLVLQAKVESAESLTNTASVEHSDQFDPDTSNNSDSATETPQQADLVVAKTVDDDTPNVGATTTFTVSLTNLGPDAATNVILGDILPPGLHFVSADPSQGTYDVGTGEWTVGAVAANAAPLTLVFQAVVQNAQATTNTATVEHSDQFDPDTSNNTDSATVTPQQADLAVTKSVDDSTPNVGETINFTVTLSNLGPDTATNVSLTDLLPAGLTFVSATPSQGSYDDSAGVWTVGTVTTAAPLTLVLAAKVQSPDPLSNTASVEHSDQFDPNDGNNSAEATETPQQADLVMGKTVDDPTPNVNDTVTYTLFVTNDGPDTATGVTVLDALPAGLEFVSATTGNGTFDAGTNIWTVGTVPVGPTAFTLTIMAKVTSANATVNIATINHSDQFDPDPTNNSAQAPTDPAQADLEVTKFVSDPNPNVGGTITFTVGLTNLGPSDATNVTLSDLLPAGLNFVDATTTQGSYDSGSGVWTVGTVTVSSTQTLAIEARVESSGEQTNTASVLHSDQVDPNPDNNQASASETPQQADLAVTKSVDDDTPNVGQTVNFTVTLSNLGPDTATNVSLTDLLPAGLTLVSATPSQGTYDDSNGLWTVGTVSTASPLTLVLEATVQGTAALTNTASVEHSDQFDPDTGNNTDSATETPQEADLAVTKSVDDDTPNVGQTVNFTITLSNLGPDTATNVSLADLLPPGLTFVSATPSQGTYDGSTGVWTVGTVITAAPLTLVLEATVQGTAALTNTASVEHSDQFDPDTSNNTDSATETPQQADLAVTKSVDDDTPNVGQTINFTVTLGNLGPDTATNVSLTDLLPVGLAFVSATPSQGTYDESTGVWTVGTVSTAAPLTLVLQATVQDTAARTNTATVEHSDQFDPDTGNNTDSATETPQQADLAVTKSVDDDTPNVGQTVNFTVTLSNLGPDTATNVSLADLLPPGLSFVTATPSQGTYDDSTGVWTVGTVSTASPLTLVLQATVLDSAALTNTATVEHSDQFDPDPSNNTDSVTETLQQADLAVTKSVDDATPNVGETINFTVTLSNLGPDTATNVSLADLLPAGLTFVSATPSQGTYDDGTGVWTVGTVSMATPLTLVLQAKVVGPDALTNTATVEQSDQFDPDSNNNTGSATETPQEADLAVTKTVDDDAPNVGDTISFTVTLTNLGPDAATNVTVGELVPAGLRIVSARPSQGTYVASTGMWTVGSVAIATPLTLVIQAIVTSAEPLNNTAIDEHSDEFDPDPGNNTSSVTETPLASDLSLMKTASAATAKVGDTLTYTLVVTNAGPGRAEGVSLQDTLPSGVQFVSASLAPISQSGGVLQFDLGSLESRASASVQVMVLAETAGSLVNHALVSSSTDDPDPSNNDAEATTIVNAATAAPEVIDLERFGFHAQPTALVLTFSTTLQATSAQTVADYELIALRSKGVPKHRIRISEAVYDSATNTVTLHPAKRLILRAEYRLVVNGTTAAGLEDPSGQLIDGDHNGTPGGNYVQKFSIGILVGPYSAASKSASKANRNQSKTRHKAVQHHVAPDPAIAHVSLQHSPAHATLPSGPLTHLKSTSSRTLFAVSQSS